MAFPLSFFALFTYILLSFLEPLFSLHCVSNDMSGRKCTPFHLDVAAWNFLSGGSSSLLRFLWGGAVLEVAAATSAVTAWRDCSVKNDWVADERCYSGASIFPPRIGLQTTGKTCCGRLQLLLLQWSSLSRDFLRSFEEACLSSVVFDFSIVHMVDR